MVANDHKLTGNISLTLIIPTLNESGNIEPLVKRVAGTLQSVADRYEIIFVDDYSHDTTVTEIKAMQKDYPIRLVCKPLRQGKSQAIIDGAAMAKYDVIGMIDADLQYPPEALAPMLLVFVNDANCGLVSTLRSDNHTNFMRRIPTFMIRHMYHILFGIGSDVQSGLKLFRRDVIEDIPVNNIGPWTLDIELFLAASRQGYTVASVPIHFAERSKGESKIHILRDGWSIVWYALRAKGREPWVGQICRFGLVGIMNTAIDIGMYLLLTRYVPLFDTNQVGAKAISYCLAALNSFIMNRSFTFRAHNTPMYRFIPFLVVSLGGVIINSSVMYLLLHMVSLPEVLGLICATIAVFAWNFLMSRRFVFSAQSHKKTPGHNT